MRRKHRKRGTNSHATNGKTWHLGFNTRTTYSPSGQWKKNPKKGVQIFLLKLQNLLKSSNKGKIKEIWAKLLETYKIKHFLQL